MKTLATANPAESLRQINKVRKKLQQWLDVTKIMELRNEKPNVDGMNEIEKNFAMLNQARVNIDKMLDSALEEHAEETAEIIALCCFVEPSQVNSHNFLEYLGAFTEMLQDESVVAVFTQLMHLAQTNGSTVSNVSASKVSNISV